MATSRALKPFYIQHTFTKVVFTTVVKAESLEAALMAGQNMNVRDVLAAEPEWIDGGTVITGVYES